jgi:hypothetical protein
MLLFQGTPFLNSWLLVIIVGFLPCTTLAFLHNSLTLSKRGGCSENDIQLAATLDPEGFVEFFCNTSECYSVVGSVLNICCHNLSSNIDYGFAQSCINKSLSVAADIADDDVSQTTSSDSAQITDGPGLAACASIEAIASVCAAETSNFASLDDATQLSCLCATTGVYDDNFNSCVNYYSTAEPEFFSSAFAENGGSVVYSPCSGGIDASTTSASGTAKTTTTAINKPSLSSNEVQSTTASQTTKKSTASSASTSTGISL